MKFPAWIALVVAGLLMLLGSVFTVSEGQAAISAQSADASNAMLAWRMP